MSGENFQDLASSHQFTYIKSTSNWPIYLTPRVLRLNSPQPRRGGDAMDAVTIQMKTIVRRVDSGVERGNWRSFVTIINLENNIHHILLIKELVDTQI